MATMCVYAVLDKAVDAYSIPLFFPSDAFAMREMTDYLARPDSHYGKHPEDFSLYRLGTFDDGSGSFELLAEPKFVVALRSLKGGES